MSAGMVGRTYRERGQLVTVLARWAVTRPGGPDTVAWLRPPKGAPRNVLIRRADGSLTVRPFRGLRRDQQPISESGGTTMTTPVRPYVSASLPTLPGVPAEVRGVRCFDCSRRTATVRHEQQHGSDALDVTVTCEGCGAIFNMLRSGADSYALGLEVGVLVEAARRGDPRVSAEPFEPFPATAAEFEGLAGLPLSDDVPPGWRACADPAGLPAREMCPAGCGCELGTEDADRRECGCDGPCTSG